MRLFLCLIQFVIWYFIAEVNAAKRAFIFNYKKLSIISLPNNVSNVDLNCDNWASACPAKDKDEEDFNAEHSVYNRALFLHEIYDNSNKKDLDKVVCDKAFEISMTYSLETKTFEFGYEVFHETTILNKISPLPFKNYFPIKKIENSPTYFDFNQKVEESNDEYKKRKKAQWRYQLRGANMDFTWIPLVRVTLQFDQILHVEYEIRKNNINPMLPCHDYSLGNETKSSDIVDLLYSKKIQQRILSGLDIPIRTSKNDAVEGACSLEYDCFIKWPLLPTDQFQFGTDSVLKCSNLTTVPIWKSTLEKIMEKLDKYLYTLQRISGQPLRIFAGVHNELKIPTKQADILVNLEQNRWKIETPRYIYKMVKFKLNRCEKDQNCWYGILIVIHNGPYLIKDNVVCDDQSETLGWEEIRYETWSNEGTPSKFIYVCKISQDTMKKLEIPYTLGTQFQPISLSEFPVLNKDKQRTLKSIKEKILREMKRLSEPGEKVELDDGVIERPFFDDNFSSIDSEDFIYEDD